MRLRRTSAPIAVFFLLIAFSARSSVAGAADDAGPERFSERLDPAGIHGSLMIGGGGNLPDAVCRRFIELAGGKNARLVLIPTAAQDMSLADRASLVSEWEQFLPASIRVMHTRSRDEADDPAFVQPLKDATGIWIGGGNQARLAAAYVGTKVETELTAVLQRGGIIGGTSAGAAIQSKVMISGGNPVTVLEQGFDLLPEAVIDQHFHERGRKPRLLAAVAQRPSRFGIGVGEETAVLVQGRNIEVLGEGKVTICLAGCANRPAREFELTSGSRADLVELRRAARERGRGDWPSAERVDPIVPKGALVLGGGGRMPAEAVQRFVELAGGRDARIVVLPTASEVPDPAGNGAVGMFEKAGARNVVVLPANTVAEVESAAFVAELSQARGIWFGGGRQWRFVDAYDQTPAVAAFHDVLRRGGVIGGSSAGASIQAEYLVRGSPRGNLEIMAEGYERGFAFLPGTAVDQHFSQRDRRRDMERLVARWPQFLGVGIDEGTVLLVQGSVAEVLGRNSAWFFDPSPADGSANTAEKSPIQVPAGGRFDLRLRQRLSDTGAGVEGQ